MSTNVDVATEPTRFGFASWPPPSCGAGYGGRMVEQQAGRTFVLGRRRRFEFAGAVASMVSLGFASPVSAAPDQPNADLSPAANTCRMPAIASHATPGRGSAFRRRPLSAKSVRFRVDPQHHAGQGNRNLAPGPTISSTGYSRRCRQRWRVTFIPPCRTLGTPR